MTNQSFHYEAGVVCMQLKIALGEEIKAREAGGSRISSTNVKRYGYHPLRGFTRLFDT